MTDDDGGYTAVRAQEAPQARLLRLAGLYDKLTDAARDEAFASGRAKDAWTQTAILAQGGSDAPKPLPGYAPSADGCAGPPTHKPDKDQPQYARELLEQFQPKSSDSASLDVADYGVYGDYGIGAAIYNAAADMVSYIYSAPLPLPKPSPSPPSPTQSLPSQPSSSYSSSETRQPPPSLPSSLSSEEASRLPPLSPENGYPGSQVWGLLSPLTAEQSDEVKKQDRARQRHIEWHAFLRYAAAKERELWKVFNGLDRDHDGRLNVSEIRAALAANDIVLSDMQLQDFIASLISSRNWHAHLTGDTIPTPTATTLDSRADEVQTAYVTWPEFRDYLLLLPRTPSVPEIVRFYKARKLYGLFRRESGIFRDLASGSWAHRYYHITTRERGGAGVTSDGDSDVAGNLDDATRMLKPKKDVEDTKPDSATTQVKQALALDDADEAEEEEGFSILPGGVALKYLLAGGVAGGISRTATAPFDRLKVFLITQASDAPIHTSKGHAGRMAEAARTLYVKGGGLRSFWVGNGLNVVKIFPESAIKFFSYETIKRAFAQHVDHVKDPRDISPRSRFLSGGLAGIVAQLSIYPVETVKTVMMSSSYNGRGDGRSTSMAVVQTVQSIYSKGGHQAFYRGLSAGLVGVFPYSAIDMSTFEGAKLAYLKASGRSDMPVYATLMIGSISGSVGAITVFPLNVVRTRLQASGTPAHPYVYAGFVDACRQTYVREGVKGFYRGLVPTLAKVIPAVSCSYTVYEQAKKLFGVL